MSGARASSATADHLRTPLQTAISGQPERRTGPAESGAIRAKTVALVP